MAYPRIVYEVEGFKDRRWQKAATARRSAQREANRTGRSVEVYKLPGGSYVSRSDAIEVFSVQPRKHKSNPSKRKAKKRAATSAKKLAAWVRSQTNRKNPVRVAATVTGAGTGWIKSKAVRVVTRGGRHVVEVKR